MVSHTGTGKQTWRHVRQNGSTSALLLIQRADLYLVEDIDKPVPEWDPQNPVDLKGFHF